MSLVRSTSHGLLRLPPRPGPSPTVCVLGDTHGHLQLGLGLAARWQIELGCRFDVVFLCGDVGTFTCDAQLDNATRRHGKTNPCELEFMHQWAVSPQPGWLQRLFDPVADGGLGLACPIVMVHGNHEGFAHLETLLPAEPPTQPVPVGALPIVDPGAHLRYLPSGWTCTTPAGWRVGGIGGIEPGQRRAEYHPLAYIDDDAVMRLLAGGPLDVLVTHQGPAATQGEVGSRALDLLLDEGLARAWFHGHSILNPDPIHAGRTARTLVVPLGDVAFPAKGETADDPGEDAWAWIQREPDLRYDRGRPSDWREFRRYRWRAQPDGQRVWYGLLP